MRKALIRTVALLMVLCSVITIFGCGEDEKTTSRETQKITEEAEITETVPVTGAEAIPTATETIPEETVAQTEAATEPQVEEVSLIPGSEQLPATALLHYTYSQLRELEWTRSNTQEGEMWILQAKSCWTDFTFVFRGEYLDANAKPTFLTVDDPDGDGYAYIAAGIKINDPAVGMPNSIQDIITPMDGGFCAMTLLDGVSATLMFLETKDMQPGILCNVQFRQEV